jgi:hypothetical protein
MPTEDQCREAVQALYRVRAVEKPPGPDGRREVWHHGSRGSELLSTVDGNGRLEDQEFRLFKEILRWQRGMIMRTGKLIRDDDVSSRDNVMWDEQPSPVRLGRSKKALGTYSGDDAYLIHLRDAIEAALSGMDWDEHRVITGPYQPGDSQEIRMPTPTRLQQLITTFKKLVRRR